MKILFEISLLIISYLLGSIPTALIISKLFFKKDIRDYGSKNMGATNTLRVLGLPYAITVFLLDAMKASIIIFLFTYGILSKDLIPHIHPIIFGFAAIIGHIFPIFAKFKGGKGVACMSGILLVYSPICFLIEIVAFLLILLFTKYVSAGSIISLLLVFILSFFIPPVFQTTPDLFFSLFCGIIFIIIVIDHWPNIIRLINGTESQITKAILSKKEKK